MFLWGQVTSGHAIISYQATGQCQDNDTFSSESIMTADIDAIWCHNTTANQQVSNANLLTTRYVSCQSNAILFHSTLILGALFKNTVQIHHLNFKSFPYSRYIHLSLPTNVKRNHRLLPFLSMPLATFTEQSAGYSPLLFQEIYHIMYL